jgi:ketosteroid isomerase-like protein
MTSTKEVLDHHLKCFGEGDLKGILSDYAPDAIMFTPDGPLRGADAMRPLFQALIAEFGKPGAVFSMKQQSVEGEYAYIIVDRGDCRQRVRDGHRYVRCPGRQDRDSVIHWQDYAQGLETRLRFWWGYPTREAITAMSGR